MTHGLPEKSTPKTVENLKNHMNILPLTSFIFRCFSMF